MKVVPVTNANDVRTRLLSLIEECQSLQWVTAWASDTDVLDAAIASSKMTHLVIGTHQYFTAPEVLDKCLGINAVKVMHPKGPLFHPKLYAFNLKERTEVFIGSSNLTNGGLERNIETGVFIAAEPNNPALQELTSHVTDLWGRAEKLDPGFIASYKANHRRVRNAKKELDEYVEVKTPVTSNRSANDVDPNEMDWSTFVALVGTDQTHGLHQRLEVLSQARQLFARALSFANLNDVEQRCIAGMIKPSTLNGIDWGLFGRMSAFGRYSPTLQQHAQQFSRALGHIPLQGEIRRENYDAYLTEFKQIPGASESWIGMGTRLLAMKRPDYFVCIDNANKFGLCDYFSVPPTTMSLDNYWDRIIAPMTTMPWWQAEMPDNNLEQAIWMGRAAMLDAIYYDPENR